MKFINCNALLLYNNLAYNMERMIQDFLYKLRNNSMTRATVPFNGLIFYRVRARLSEYRVAQYGTRKVRAEQSRWNWQQN